MTRHLLSAEGHTCNRSCYGAKHEPCTCGCGGENHGRGATAALENPKNLAPVLPFFRETKPEVEEK